MTPGNLPEVELWTKLVKLHNLTKAHILYCEEQDDSFRTFIQPRNEWCNAFEHLMRAKASELGLKSAGPDPDYIHENLSAAVGHEYRAFFDVADWLSVKLRRRIREELEPYSKDAIKAVLPDYYDSVRPRLESFTREIAAIRGAKDIALDEGLLVEVERYNVVLEELKTFSTRATAVVGALERVKIIQATLEPYSKDAIKTALPDYYDKVLPRLSVLSPATAALVPPAVTGSDLVAELDDFGQRVAAAVPSLAELKAKEERALSRTQRWDVLKMIVGPLATLAAGYWLSKLF